jgi:hypothetical protein
MLLSCLSTLLVLFTPHGQASDDIPSKYRNDVSSFDRERVAALLRMSRGQDDQALAQQAKFLRDSLRRWFYSDTLCRMLIEELKGKPPADAKLQSTRNYVVLNIIAECVDSNASDDVIEFLATRIEHHHPRIGVSTWLLTDANRPALLSLMRIGRRATKAVMNRAIATDDTQVIHACGRFLEHHYGRSIGMSITEKWYETYTDEGVRRRLSRLRAYLQFHTRDD